MKTRCKMKCVCADTDDPHGNDETFCATFEAVIDGSPENEKFFKYTPFGELRLGVVSKQHFEVGKEYYIDISLAE